MNIIEIRSAKMMGQFADSRAVEIARQRQIEEEERQQRANDRLAYQIKALQDEIQKSANWGYHTADYEIYPKNNPTVWEDYERNIVAIIETFKTAGYEIVYTARRPGYRYYESGQTGYFTISWR